jgi:uncharacterized protein YfaS (alpha-2-macroglobulin family)
MRHMSPASRHVGVGLAVVALLVGSAMAGSYVAGDRVVRTAPKETEVLPERFLRGFDPITVTFTSDVARGPGPADDAAGLATLKPAWPGAWTFVDARTLQFRPAEPWPALHRFAVEAKGTTRVLTTMMTAPLSMSPDAGSAGLAPFRTLTLTFPQALPEKDLRGMIRLEVRDLPGLDDARRRPLTDFTLALLPRRHEREPATYALGLPDDVPESSVLVVTVALALGDEAATLWQGKASTRTAFRLEEVSCAGTRVGVLGEPHVTAEQALDCGSRGDEPQLTFSAPVGGVGLTALKKLVRLEPAVADLSPRVSGRRVTLTGRFVPETLYRLRLGDAPILDEHGRRLQDPGEAVVHFFVGRKQPHLRVKRGQLTVEQLGPRMLPVSAVGDTRVDVRLHRIDPRHAGLWPFPDEAVVIDEGSDPPFPGEEPETPAIPGQLGRRELEAHLRLLGSPLVSRVVALPKASVAGGSFGLDLGPLLDSAPGARPRAPGTWLVGVRRLEGAPERAWARVQVTNLSLTVIEERERAVFVVRAVDSAAPVPGASVTVEAVEEKTGALKQRSVSTDGEGRASLPPEAALERIVRVLVEKGDDVLVIDPSEPPPRFFSNHWMGRSTFLGLLTEPVPPAPKNDATLGFLFTERPIYRPGETVYLKGFVREKRDGVLTLPLPQKATPTSTTLEPQKLTIKVTRPGGDEVTLTTTTTALFGGDAAFVDKDPVTGWHTARLFLGAQATPVATRRFQVEAYRVPTFEVRLNGPERAPLDRPFKVTANGRYYAGGSVADQPIRWTVTRRPAWHTPKGREGFLFASSTQFARPDAGQRAEQLTKSGTLDALGADAIEVNPEKDLDGSPRTYRFEATVTGADDQEVSAVTEVLALPPFVLGMKLERFKKEATQVVPEVIAVGVDDKAVAGQKVEVRLLRRTWHSHLRESHFATGQASYVTEQEDSVVTTTTVTTTAVPLPVPLPIDRAGVYVVELVGKDKLGRVQTLSADLYVGGREPVSWQKGQAGVFELVAHQTAFAPGDTAHVVVKSPFQNAKGLLIVEGPRQNTYRPFDVVGGSATLDIGIDKSATPNLPVHVVLSRGRLPAITGTGEGDDAPWRPQTVAASLDLEVKPLKNQLTVKVEHPAQARPGDTIDLTVTLKDDAGKAMDGEATLWLVDEAVLALAKEGPLDPLTALITRNARDTSVSDTRNSLLGRLLEEESPGGDGAEGEDAAGKASRRVRKNFQTVPFYQATVVVKGGRAVVKVPLSDDLTNFMVRAVAVSGAERFGRHESTLKVRLPVIVQPQLPRFVRQGDRFEGGGVARLVEGEGGPGIVKAEYRGPVVERRRSADVVLEKDKARSVTFPVEVSSQPSDGPLVVKMEVLKKKDGQGDAFEVSIPVLPDGRWQTSASLSTITETAALLPGPPEAPRPGTATQTIVMSHVPGLLEVLGAIDSLVAYPHGCLEQKMARLSPSLSLLQLKRRLEGVDLGAGSQTRANLERLLGEFPAHQDDKGLFGYWPGSSGDVQLTARALSFMTAAKAAGVTVDDAVQTRARQAVVASLRSDAVWDASLLPWRAPLLASSLRALSLGGAVDDAALGDLLRARKTLDATGRAELALAALQRGEPFAADARAMKDELWGSVTFQQVGGRRAVVGLNDPRAVWGGRVLGSSTSSLATVLEALVRLDPQHPDLPLVVEALLARGRGTTPGFGSTWDNQAAVAAILAYVDVANPPGQQSAVTIGADTLQLDGNKKLARLVKEGTQALTAKAIGVPVQARTTWRYLPAQTADRLPAAKNGFLVQRAMTIYPAAGGAPRRVDDVRAGEASLMVGDVVEFHVTVTSDQPRHHVAIVMPFGAGLEPLNPELKTSNADAVPAERDTLTPTSWARLDHETRAYVTSLPKGTFTWHFRARATTPGSYAHPGAFAELMYDAGMMGRSDGSRLIVTRGQE